MCTTFLAAWFFVLTAPAPARPEMETRHVDEKAYMDEVRQRVATRLKVAPEELRFSPGLRWLAFVSSPPAPKRRLKRPPPRRHRIVITDTEGRRRATYAAVSVRGNDDPPRDLRFMDDGRMLYEVPLPAPAPLGPLPKGKGGKKPEAAPPAPSRPEPPRQLFVIQPIRLRSRPIRCEGTRFALPERKNHIAYVASTPAGDRIMVDGRRIYPPGNGVFVASDLAWSKDGLALAFVERQEGAAPRLALLGDIGNRTGDTGWELPANAQLDGVRVFWANPGRLVVGKSVTAPLFSVSFQIERPQN